MHDGIYLYVITKERKEMWGDSSTSSFLSIEGQAAYLNESAKIMLFVGGKLCYLYVPSK